ncbi:uncharacterized protein [Palaemon carinicauda]|uniref:uncharacterized protein n=1 Tax=Palaemon carinicauda TaxID=392227 RepID=UPI0035B5988F
MTLEQLGKTHEIDSQMLIIEVLARFPLYIRNRWKKYAVDVKRSQGEYPNFEGLVSFMEREVDEATDPVYGNIGAKMRDDNSKFKKNSTTSPSSFVTGTFEHPPCVLCPQDHKIVHSNNLQRNVENRSVVNASSTDVTAEYQVFMPVVSVPVNKSHQTTVLLDGASSSTFCSRDLMKSLGISGAVKTYKLNTMSKTNEDVSSMIVSMCVSSVDGRELINLNDFVVDRIQIESASMNVSLFSHLKGLPGPLGGEIVHILIGQDHAEAMAPLEVRKGKRGEPFVVRTILGWTLYGPAQVVNPVGQSIVSHFVSTKACVGSDINVLWNIENDGISDNVSWSMEDREVIKLWDSECILGNGQHQIPIPWKSDFQVSNNYVMALSRFKATKRSLMRRGLFTQYDGEMQKLISKGYAEAVSTNVSIPGTKVGHLSQQAIVSNKKTRFREHAYAVIADIEAMYYQVVIPKKDRDALRFIWFNDAGEIVHYRMTRHVFGGVWCSSSSAYALGRVLVDEVYVPLLVSGTIKRSFYVDNCLKSLPYKSLVSEVVKGTTEVLSKGGFSLTKFVMNDEELLSLVPIQERASEVEFLKDFDGRALGIAWDVAGDEFCFRVNLAQECDTKLTRRKILSMLASIYDPLGLVNPVTVKGKLLLQEATICKLSWDDPIPKGLACKWSQWYSSLDGLREIEISRCIKPIEFNEAALVLHHFTEASQVAYGCSSYLRSTNQAGEIHVALVVRKSKMAPIESMTILRLELQAAVLAAKMDDTLRNRASLFQQLTKPEQWSFVQGVQNPADLLTRGISPESLEVNRWFEGPEFLHDHKVQWHSAQEFSDTSIDVVDPEVPKRGKRGNVEQGLTAEQLRVAEVAILRYVQGRRYASSEGRLSDEGLETLFCEVEFVINGRPITKVSDDVLDISPLTCNHLLMLSENVALPPGVFKMLCCRLQGKIPTTAALLKPKVVNGRHQLQCLQED